MRGECPELKKKLKKEKLTFKKAKTMLATWSDEDEDKDAQATSGDEEIQYLMAKSEDSTEVNSSFENYTIDEWEEPYTVLFENFCIPCKTPETIFPRNPRHFFSPPHSRNPETLDPIASRRDPSSRRRASWSSASSGFAVAASEGICSRRRGSVAASEKEEEEEVSSPACSSTSCSSSCFRDPPRSFAPITKVQADPLLLLTLVVRCVELKHKVPGVPFDSLIDTLLISALS
ncbi:hypothetical protein Taro_053648 [Colocasia esculenta]|uniref:Uncharacterized protein n=1 Tax=Colocasia esculenta TaxID=4460 RepID=A0A843XLQ5_COLES|nr:hypothetical protein [Colocasia esculenta]